MPCPSKSKPTQIIRIILTGHLNLAELGDLTSEMALLDADFGRVPDRLTDLSDVENGDFSFSTVEGLTEKPGPAFTPTRSDRPWSRPKPLHYSLARMFQTPSKNQRIDFQIL